MKFWSRLRTWLLGERGFIEYQQCDFLTQEGWRCRHKAIYRVMNNSWHEMNACAQHARQAAICGRVGNV